MLFNWSCLTSQGWHVKGPFPILQFINTNCDPTQGEAEEFTANAILLHFIFSVEMRETDVHQTDHTNALLHIYLLSIPLLVQPGGHDAQITTAKPYIIAGWFHHSFLSCFHLHCALLPENSLLIWTLSSAGKKPYVSLIFQASAVIYFMAGHTPYSRAHQLAPL